jgi:protein O-mannosyl-transferase
LKRREKVTGKRQRGQLLLALLLVALTCWAYRTSFQGVFVFDDVPTIVANPHVRTLWPLSRAMSAPAEVTVSGRPVAALSLALNYALAPADVRDVMQPPGPQAAPDEGGRFLRNLRGYHGVNLAIHLGAGLTLFGVVRRTLRSAALRDRFGPASTSLAAVVALLWMVHPLQTESVTYIVQRVESLMGLFFFLTLYAAIRAHDPERRVLWTVAAVFCCALGMGSKEVMVTAPVVVLLWDWLFARSVRGRWGLYAGLAATWIVLAFVVWTESRPSSVGARLLGWTPWSYLLTQTAVVVHYLRLSLWPSPLVIDYGWPMARSIGDVAWQAALLLALFGVTVVLIARRRPLGFLGAWFFLILAPTSSVLPIATEIAAEHRMYLPLAAVITAIVLGAARLRLRGVVAGVIVAVVAATLVAHTAARNRDYWTDEGLWEDAVEKRPDNPRARVSLGAGLYAAGRLDEAEREFRIALSLDESSAPAHLNLGSVLCAKGRVDEGVAHLERALALDPASPDAHRNLGEAHASRGELAAAVADFSAVVQAKPDDVFALNRLAWLLATSPQDRLRNGTKAVALAEHTVALTGRRDVESLDVLGAAYAETQRFADASRTAREAQAFALRAGLTAIADELAARIALYDSGQPFRERSR